MTAHAVTAPAQQAPAEAGFAIEIRRKSWPGQTRPVLAGVRLVGAPGEFVCLIGPSGCGKSTLLHLIAGLDEDFDGAVHRPPGRTGVVFQTPRLLPWLSALDNVRLVLPADADAQGARDGLAALGLGEVLDHLPAQLSGGQQRRVALARAFAVAPRLLLLDEPLVSLDAPVATRLRALLLDHWRATQATIVCVTHDLAEALTLADRVVFLGGRPAFAVHEQRVDLSRPRDPAAIAALARELLATHPELLAGIAGAPDLET